MTINPSKNIRSRLHTFVMLIALGGASFGAFFGVTKLPEPLIDHMMEIDIRNESDLWRRRVVLNMQDAEEAFAQSRITPNDARYLNLMPEASDTYNFRLINTIGEVFWSTDPADIGEYVTRSYFDNIVAKGETYYSHEVHDVSEVDDVAMHVSDPNTNTERHIAVVVKPYVVNGNFLGAIQFFTDQTALRRTFIGRARVLLVALTSGSILALFLAVFVVFRSNRRRVAMLQHHANSERNSVDKELRIAR